MSDELFFLKKSYEKKKSLFLLLFICLWGKIGVGSIK